MERQFFINWPLFVKEARLRRKNQKLTQQRLAALAGVSTPTISHFENGEKDIQLSTVLSILNILGMSDQRQLQFENSSPRYDFDREVVIFKGRDGSKTIFCAISKEALEDHFHGQSKELLKIFEANRERIEHETRRKYFAEMLEPDGSVLVKTGDI